MFQLNWGKLLFGFMAISDLIIILLSSFRQKYLINTNLLNLHRYGKLISADAKSKTNNIHLPKTYFKHYYLLPALFIYPYGLYLSFNAFILNKPFPQWMIAILHHYSGGKQLHAVSATHIFIAIILATLQVWKRFYEVYFVSVFSENAKINIFQYFCALIYYPALLMNILSESPKFTNTANLDQFNWEEIRKIDILAIGIFFWAWYHQHVAIRILANLRNKKKGIATQQKYYLPEGDWFKYLSSPHYVAEILIYTSLTILLSSNTSWWYIYVLVLINQLDSIIGSHKWYKKNFKDFPQERKALIPYFL